MNRSIALTIVTCLGFGIVACKDASEPSSLRTLDNIANARPIFEACRGEGPIHAKAGLNGYPHLQSALAAVPMTLQVGFFDDLGGIIRIIDDSDLRDCAINSDRVDDGLSCWRRLPNRTNSIEIIIRKTTREKEQYALVRAFGFIYGDILLNRIIPQNASDPVTISERPAGNLRDFKVHLASTFIGDLITLTPKEKLPPIVATLEDLGLPRAITTETDFQRRWLQFSRLSAPLQDALSSRIFAESFHSQFCSTASAKRACGLYPNTMKSFAPYAQDLTSAAWLAQFGCETKSIQSRSGASSTRQEWFSQHAKELSLRRSQGKENGSLVNFKIAELAAKDDLLTAENSRTASFGLSGGFLSLLQSLLTGGLSSGGGGGGFGGILSQIFGGLGAGGGGSGGGLGGLSGLLSSLGLGSSGGLGTLGGSGGGDIPSIPSNPGNNPIPTPNNGGGIATAEEQAAIDATNRYRQSQGKQPLQMDAQMIADCRKQAQMQADRGGLQHWLYPAGIATGENIAYGSTSGEYTVMEQWVKSPGHHANIMGNYNHIGVGNVGNQWCQRFR